MAFSPLRARSFGLLLLSLLASGAAQAAEVMHMPFECRFDGARVHLRPSEERSYAVIGQREREVFTTCSPSDPERCSSWLVHRFDFDCNGDRVAWIDAAAAATQFADWDAWIEEGSFRMRMSPEWGVARARPYFQRRRMMRRHFLDPEERDAFGPGESYGAHVVTAPPGFAPAVGIPLTFSGGSPDVAETPAAPVQGAPAVAAYTAEPAPALIPDLPERAPPKEQRIAAATPPPVAAPAPKPAVKVATPEPQPAPPRPETIAADAKAGGGATPAAKTEGFTIINHASPSLPAPTSSQSANAAARIETSAVSAPLDIGTKSAAAPASHEVEAVAQATPASPASEPAAPVSTPRPGSGIAMPEISVQTAAAAAGATLALAGLAIFGIWRWRRQPPPALPIDRDIADISLGGGLRALAFEGAPATPDVSAPENSSGEVAEAVNNLPVPATYAQALEILGASPDASTAAIKKIVDGLRQSWHPDLARSESDRLQREARVRQINVAWDLVSQRRSAA